MTLIRPARPEEEDAINALILRSKAHWGYDEAFMQAAVDDMKLAPNYLHDHWNFILEEDRQMVGIASLIAHEDAVELDNLFLEPETIGKGYGGMMWDFVLDFARRQGFAKLWLVSDPNAAGFYESRGAVKIGEVASNIQAGRTLPKYEIELIAK